MGVGNHFGLVLDMSRGGLEGPGREFKKKRITAMGSYLVAVGKTAPFGTFLVTARPGS